MGQGRPRAIRVCDLAHLDELEPRLDSCARITTRCGRLWPARSTARSCRRISPRSRLRPAIRHAGVEDDVRRRAARGGASVRGRAGRAASRRSGTYRFTSPTRWGHCCFRRGAGPSAAGFVLASLRPTPLRSAPGPSRRAEDETGQKLGERGHEFGTVTGRKRRCGWLMRCWCGSPAPSRASPGSSDQARRARRVRTDPDLQRLSSGRRGDRHFRPMPPIRRGLSPSMRRCGWSESTAGARSWAALPAQAIKYIRRIRN